MEHLRARAFFAKVNLRTVHLVKHNRRDSAHDLQSKVLCLDNVDCRNKRIHDKRQTVRVLYRHLVGLALDNDGGIVASADEDRLCQRSLNLNRLILLLKVFLENAMSAHISDIRQRHDTYNCPLFAIELLLRRFLHSHAFRLRLLARSRALWTTSQAV